MSSIQELLRIGRELGYEDEELRSFVSSEQARLRDEREQERQERREREERERDDRDKERLREQEKEERERLEREREREHVLALERLKLQTAGNTSVTNPGVDPASRPKLPVYKEGEDIASYFTRFERIAVLLNISHDAYAIHLGSLLTGKLAEFYTTLSEDVTGSYSHLKEAILKHSHKTSDHYRTTFRSSKISVGDTYQQFATHLSRLFDHWLNASEVDSTYAALRSFMILDQFMASLPSDLRMFLKENNIQDLDEAVKRADVWASAHHSYPRKHPDLERMKPPLPANSTSLKGTTPNRTSSKVQCHNCGQIGHIRPNCPQNPYLFQPKSKLDPTKDSFKIGFCHASSSSQQYYSSGTINGSRVSTILRDTGCTSVLVSEEALPDVDVSSCKQVRCTDYLGREDSFPEVRCYLRCPYFDGWVKAVRAPLKFCSVLVGNVEGVRIPDDPDVTISSNFPNFSPSPEENVQTVQTRAAAARKVHPLVLPNLQTLAMTPQDFARLQSSCPTLTALRDKASSGEEERTRSGSIFKYEISNGLLYRVSCSSNNKNQEGRKYLVVPADCRRSVLSVSHESPLAGHLSHRKTGLKIGEQFHWPGMWSDIRAFCKSCDKCQRMSLQGRVKPVPLKQLPIITEPFSRVAVDIVGPLSPPTSEGHRYILTLIDFATGFPEAVPLRDVTSISTAEALLSIFARTGIPREILSDRGTQFTSQMMAELHRLLGTKPLFTTPYHPSANGRIERFHSTLKSSLRKLCSDKPREWHRYLPAILFAMREMPSDRTGFSAFELLYGRAVRGPVSVLRDLWEDSKLTEDERSCFQYVIELKDKLADCSRIAAHNASISATKYKSYFDLKSQDRQFKPGEEVLVLLPDTSSKLLMSWSGPHTVLERRNRVNYLVDHNGKQKLYHANLLKRYHRRARINLATVLDESSTLTEEPDVQEVTFTPSEEEFLDPAEDLPLTPDGRIDDCPDAVLTVGDQLSSEQRENILTLTTHFNDVFSEVPGCTSIIKHDIQLCSAGRIKPKLYPIPLHIKPFFQQEVEQLLQQGIIRPSTSQHGSPVVMVKKPNGSYRLAVDFRVLNSMTTFDAEPINTITEDLHKFFGCKYFSELDLTKAYYQVPLSDRAKALTAFPSHLGLMEFCRLPFGLVTACATYIRLMRIVLAGLEGVTFYFDNIFIFGTTWETHLYALHSVLLRLRQHGLTARPSKCRFGFNSIEYLGFIVDGKTLRPQDNKVEAISSVSPPSSKKLLRSFLGMVSFYRLFIPDAATYTSGLSDLLRKNIPFGRMSYGPVSTISRLPYIPSLY